MHRASFRGPPLATPLLGAANDPQAATANVEAAVTSAILRLCGSEFICM
jgi:hypothetical protein